MKRKFLTLFVALAMCLNLAACGGSKQAEAPAPAAESAQQEEAKGIAKEDLLVGFVQLSDPSDMGYTYNHDLGTQKMKENLGLTDEQVISKYNTPDDMNALTAVNELIEAGCQIIFATSFGHEDAILEAAAQHPEIQFCHATGYRAASSGLPNMHNYFVNIYEARYLCGIAAGLKTESNHLGYVAAFPFAEVISGYTAFYLGAKSVNPDVTMDVMYTNSWNDPVTEAQVAKSLIDRGCDVISQHSDATSSATTCEEAGVFHCGYNADMSEAAPQASVISARADWSVYLTYAVQCMLDGEEIATDWSEGFNEGACYLSPLNTAIAAEGTQEAIDAAQAAITAGDLHVFAGPLTDVEGNVVVPEGEYFHESEEVSAPAWAYVLEGINVLE